ncbi:hypothetical protein [Rhizobium binae]|uniref:hypothetical protein n=1 Tax=Rhizobium binae TaxID=1138190 RepID=UPI001C83B5CA|nr:hypothetical protein [Rhizobium binae]MBX4940977.1 hypothetical protein [Rhizobium binae]MBX4942382.1 hypothetical protein [Rhizobium binae]MBX4982103.1 hypothetical protein [Rhizobium binae]
MTQILNITRNDDGQYEITDQRGKVVAGPFVSNAAAWKELDRLDNQDANVPDKRRSNKPVLWGQPEKGKSKKKLRREKKIAARQQKQMKRDARNAAGWVRDIASTKFDPQAVRNYRDHKLGTFGAASEVRCINPATYLAEKAAKEAILAVNNVEGGSS